MVRESLTDDQRSLLLDDVNRAIVDVLDGREQPLHVDDLGERIVDREVAVVRNDEYEARRERIDLALHHHRLPKLAAAGLVEYDPGTNLVSRRGSDGPEAEWHEAASMGAVVESLSNSADARGVGIIRGRESIAEYGRRLADEADEELFCLYVDTDLLGEECVRRAADAVDRGVTMYVGSASPDVRDLTRERLPEATIWEPQLDLLNTPTYPRIGRLVLADRRSVMLAVLEEPEPGDATAAETAVVGSGEDDPVVALVRDLLGPRLDHLDRQSADFRGELAP